MKNRKIKSNTQCINMQINKPCVSDPLTIVQSLSLSIFWNFLIKNEQMHNINPYPSLRYNMMYALGRNVHDRPN